MKKIIFYLNILADNTRTGSKTLYALVESHRTESGRILIEFMNLNTSFVTTVINWDEVFTHSMERAKIKWAEVDSNEPSEDDVINELIANHQLL